MQLPQSSEFRSHILSENARLFAAWRLLRAYKEQQPVGGSGATDSYDRRSGSRVS